MFNVQRKAETFIWRKNSVFTKSCSICLHWETSIKAVHIKNKWPPKAFCQAAGGIRCINLKDEEENVPFVGSFKVCYNTISQLSGVRIMVTLRSGLKLHKAVKLAASNQVYLKGGSEWKDVWVDSDCVGCEAAWWRLSLQSMSCRFYNFLCSLTTAQMVVLIKTKIPKNRTRSFVNRLFTIRSFKKCSWAHVVFFKWWNLPRCAFRGCSLLYPFMTVSPVRRRLKDSIPITLLIPATRMFWARSGFFPYMLRLWFDANNLFIVEVKGSGVWAGVSSVGNGAQLSWAELSWGRSPGER